MLWKFIFGFMLLVIVIALIQAYWPLILAGLILTGVAIMIVGIIKMRQRKQEQAEREAAESEAKAKAEALAAEREAAEAEAKAKAEALAAEREAGYRAHRETLAAVPVADICMQPGQRLKRKPLTGMPSYTLSNVTARSRADKLQNYVVVDTETTGVNMQSGRIVELSAIRFEGFAPVEAWTTLVNPGKHIPEAATAVNGITDDMVADAPTLASVAPSFLDFVGDAPIVGHNLEFDLKFLYASGVDLLQDKRKLYDTWPLSRKAFPGQINYKLSTIAALCGLPTEGAHGSLFDCYMSGKVFEACVNQLIDTAEN